jgi:hypothetical protein
MSSPFPTRRAVLVSGAALAVHSALGLPTGRMTRLPMAKAHDMAEIITKYIAAELALSEHLVTDAMPLEALYRHVLAQEQGVEVQHVVDQVGSLGFRETDVIAIGLIMGVEAFFDAEIPDDAMGTMHTVGDLQACLLPRIPARAAPSLPQLLQTGPAQAGLGAVNRNL